MQRLLVVTEQGWLRMSDSSHITACSRASHTTVFHASRLPTSYCK